MGSNKELFIRLIDIVLIFQPFLSVSRIMGQNMLKSSYFGV